MGLGNILPSRRDAKFGHTCIDDGFLAALKSQANGENCTLILTPKLASRFLQVMDHLGVAGPGR